MYYNLILKCCVQPWCWSLFRAAFFSIDHIFSISTVTVGSACICIALIAQWSGTVSLTFPKSRWFPCFSIPLLLSLSLSLSFSLQRLYYRNYSRERCNYRVLQCTEERMFWLTYTIKFSREGCVRSRQIGEEKTKQVFLVTSQNNSRQQIIDKHFRYWQIALTVATLSLRCHPLPLSLSFSSFWPIFV